MRKTQCSRNRGGGVSVACGARVRWGSAARGAAWITGASCAAAARSRSRGPAARLATPGGDGRGLSGAISQQPGRTMPGDPSAAPCGQQQPAARCVSRPQASPQPPDAGSASSATATTIPVSLRRVIITTWRPDPGHGLSPNLPQAALTGKRPPASSAPDLPSGRVFGPGADRRPGRIGAGRSGTASGARAVPPPAIDLLASVGASPGSRGLVP